VILTGAGGEFIPEIDFSSFGKSVLSEKSAMDCRSRERQRLTW